MSNEALARFVLATLIVFSSAVSNAQRGSSASEGIVEISGREHPELVPEYRAWGHTFRLLARGPRHMGGSAFPDSLREHVTQADEAMILREADRLQRLAADCMKRAIETPECRSRSWKLLASHSRNG